jgi:enoyl-CoA hydratase/carnithine racemase
MSIIEYWKEGHIAFFRINRPEALGALNVKGITELHDTLVDFRNDDELFVGIITGTGDKAFSAGVDIKDFLPFIKMTAGKPWQVPGTIMRGLETYGGGLELALGCDIRIASENARFALPEVTLGVVPGGGGTQRLPRIIPRGIAAEMLFTGKSIDAQEAYRVGLVNKVVPIDRLMSTAKEIAESICKNGQLAVRAAKEAMMRGTSMSLEDGLRLEDSLTQFIVSTKDFSEGTQAFIEKRKPKFEGK